MSRTTLPRRRVLLGGLTMPALVPIARAHAQGSAAAPQPGRAPFGLTWGMNSESVSEHYGAFAKLDDYGILRLLDHGEVVDGWGITHRFFDLPRVPHDTNMVDLSFGYRDRLFRVYAKGKEWPG